MKTILTICLILLSTVVFSQRKGPNYGKQNQKLDQVMMVNVTTYSKSKKIYDQCINESVTEEDKSVCESLVTYRKEKRVLIKNVLVPCDSVTNKKYKKMCDSYQGTKIRKN